jgi:hypothetical protein
MYRGRRCRCREHHCLWLTTEPIASGIRPYRARVACGYAVGAFFLYSRNPCRRHNRVALIAAPIQPVCELPLLERAVRGDLARDELW